jgi:DNA-directed RNA polymerase subunit omega
MSTVIQEIIQDKIYLDLTGRVQVRGEAEEAEGGTVDLTQPAD